MARFGILTGGGDCPGLNAVIRGVVRAGVNRHGHQIVGFRYGWAGVLEANTVELTAAEHRGHPAPRRHDPRDVAHQSLQGRGRRHRARARDARAGGHRCPDPHRRRGHARRRGPAGRRRRAGGRRPQDDRQRPGRHRRHLRLPHRGADRHRCHRPPAHDRGVAQPRHHPRGHGPPRGLDRRLQRHRRRGRRDPRPRAPVRHRRGLRAHQAPPCPRDDVLDRRRLRGRDAARRRRASPPPGRRPTPSATRAWAGSRSSSRARSRSAPGSRPA